MLIGDIFISNKTKRTYFANINACLWQKPWIQILEFCNVFEQSKYWKVNVVQGFLGIETDLNAWFEAPNQN